MDLSAETPAGRSRVVEKLLLLACVILAIIIYLPVIRGLAGQWMADPNYRHGLLIPLISGLIVWRERGSLSGPHENIGNLYGLILIFIAAGLLITGTAAAELFTARVSLPLMMFGIILYLGGRRFAGKIAFPVLFLLMMVPLPYIIYFKMTFPMQILSARLSSAILRAIGVSVIRKGNILMLPGYTLEVVAACSGLRSLMTMITLSMVFAYFSSLGKTKKIILVACSVPVAIAANMIRLVVTALGAYTVGAGFADGPLHEISGLIVFLAGMLLLMLCAGVLKWIK
ncbi:MAG: exosortase/archaeosortase family protein [Candidatus Krumholzibacteria bacterium]|nr:exosortase/archaeosortase family protein [Candidatus Krumholzibacteria bacterium]